MLVINNAVEFSYLKDINLVKAVVTGDIPSKIFVKEHHLAVINCSYEICFVEIDARINYSFRHRYNGDIIGIVNALFKIKDSYNMDWFSQTLGLAALNDLPAMRANVRKILATRSRMTDALRQRGWKVLDSQTNFLFAAPPCDARTLFESLKANKIFVRYFPGTRTGKFLRITMGTDDQMDRFLAVIDSQA